MKTNKSKEETHSLQYNVPGEISKAGVFGTLKDLIQYFSYILKTAHSRDKLVARKPTTIKNLVSCLNRAYEITGDSKRVRLISNGTFPITDRGE